MTLEEHLKLIIGDQAIVIAGLRAEIDRLKAQLEKPAAGEAVN